MLSDRERRELADMERRLRDDDPPARKHVVKRPPKPERLLWWPVLSLLVLYAGSVSRDSFLITLGLLGMLLSGTRVVLALADALDGRVSGHDGPSTGAHGPA